MGVVHGRLLAFDNLRAPDGRVREGVWDRICVPGHDEKDGQSTDFDARTLSEMIDNFVARGDEVPMDWNHQSNYASQNGRPAPALAFYSSLAVVWDGKLAKVGTANGHEPATGAEPGMDLSKDGLWGYRCTVTDGTADCPLGQQLLPGFKFLSPTFTPNGVQRDGTEVGYSLAAVAATNTPWQSGTEITFDREEVQMARPGQLSAGDLVKWRGKQAKVISGEGTKGDQVGMIKIATDDGLDVGWVPLSEITPIRDRKMDSGSGVKMANLDDFRPNDRVRALNVNSGHEETGRVVNISGEKLTVEFPDGSTAVKHFTNVKKMDNAPSGASPKGVRPMAKLAALSKLLKMDGEPSDEDTKKALESKMADESKKAAMDGAYDHAGAADALEQMAKAYEDAKMDDGDGEPPHAVMRKMAARFRKMGAPAESPEEKATMEKPKDEKDGGESAMQVMGATIRGLTAKVEAFERAEQAKARDAERARDAEVGALADAAVKGGYPAEDREALVVMARSNRPAAERIASAFVGRAAPTAPAYLFDRLTAAGGPLGAPRGPSGSAGPDLRTFELGALGITARVAGMSWSERVRKMADATDEPTKAKVWDAAPEEYKADRRYHAFARYLGAEKILRRDDPAAWDSQRDASASQ